MHIYDLKELCYYIYIKVLTKIIYKGFFTKHFSGTFLKSYLAIDFPFAKMNKGRIDVDYGTKG